MENAVLRVDFAKPVTQHNADTVMKAIQDRLREATAVEVDLNAVGSTDLYAVAVTAKFQRLCQERGLAFRTRHATTEVQQALQHLADAWEQRDIPGGDPLPLQIGEKSIGFCRDIKELLGFIGELTWALYEALRHPTRVRWKDTLHYMDRCGTDGLPIVLLICLLMGLILGFQAALQLRIFGADIFAADLVGLSVTRELGPLMVAMICTGRAGSAFAAEIGTMTVSEEVDALITMGLEPNRFLVVPKLLALMAVMPLLTVFGDVAGIAGGFIVAVTQMDLPFMAYWTQTIGAINQWDVLQGLVKSVVFAFCIAAVGCMRGLQTRGGARGVGVSTTSAVVSGIFLIVITDALMTTLFARLGLAT